MDARLLGVRCLVETEAGGYSNLVFKTRAPQSGLDGQALSFAAAIFYGALERQITLDYLLAPMLKKGLAALDPEVRAILRAGLYQCLYMDGVPVHAAVDESVRLCRKMRKSSAAGLVNAVLRKAAARGLAPLAEIADERTALSVRYALCPALVALLLEQYGGDAPAIMQAMLGRPQAAARVNTLRTGRAQMLERLAAQGIPAQAAPLANAVCFADGGYLRADAFADGTLRVQSLAAQGAVAALAVRPGMTLLDLCAAPGGKTLTAAQEMRGEGEILALDRYENRLRLVQAQAEREGISIVRTLCADAAAYRTDSRFDRVLCDVPCSGYGEIAAKPELRQKPPQADNPLFETQRAILRRGAALLRPGGRLVYSSCTIDRRENEEAVQSFLIENPAFRLCPVTLPGFPPPEREGWLRLLPGINGNGAEGFFIAAMERQ